MICVPLEGLSETDKFPSTIKSQTVTLIQKPVCTYVQDFLCTDTSGETHQHDTALYHNIVRDWDGVGICKDIFSQACWEIILVEIFLVPLGKVYSKFS